MRCLAVPLLIAAASLVQAAAHSAIPICASGKRVTCVVDGDTVWVKGVKYPFEEIDTPEKGQPRRVPAGSAPGRRSDRAPGGDRFGERVRDRGQREGPLRTRAGPVHGREAERWRNARCRRSRPAVGGANRGLVQVRPWEWLTKGRKRHANVVATAGELVAHRGDQARYTAIEFARLTQDGKLVEDGKDAQFWWQVVNEIDRLQGRVRLDTGTRYVDQ